MYVCMYVCMYDALVSDLSEMFHNMHICMYVRKMDWCVYIYTGIYLSMNVCMYVDSYCKQVWLRHRCITHVKYSAIPTIVEGHKTDKSPHPYCHSHRNWGPQNSFQRFLVQVYYWKTVEKPETDPQLLWEWQYVYFLWFYAVYISSVRLVQARVAEAYMYSHTWPMCMYSDFMLCTYLPYGWCN